MDIQELYTVTGQELKQREEEGCDVSSLRERYAALGNADDQAKRTGCERLLEEAAGLTPRTQYVEPSDLEAIRSERPHGPRRIKSVFSRRDLLDRTYGAWLGRCAGCLLGKPVEGWTRQAIRELAEPDGNYPLRDYFSAVAPHQKRERMAWDYPCMKGQIQAMARDDDIDYTITGLLLLERYGSALTTRNVAEFWLAELPYHKVYTAERVAYRNLVDGLEPPETATYRNPCREWIGAQIRADAFGYATPGWPERAAEFAFRDAALSHVMNGVYGEMFVAAMIAAAYVEKDIRKIIQVGLSEIPARSRLAEAVRNVMEWWEGSADCADAAELSPANPKPPVKSVESADNHHGHRQRGRWENVSDRIDEHYGDLQGCHTITNAAIVVLGLLAGEDDFTTGLACAIMPGYDTDCNGATTGSILGARLGVARLPRHWTEPLNDRVRSALFSFPEGKISELAERSVRVAERILLDAAE